MSLMLLLLLLLLWLCLLLLLRRLLLVAGSQLLVFEVQSAIGDTVRTEAHGATADCVVHVVVAEVSVHVGKIKVLLTGVVGRVGCVLVVVIVEVLIVMMMKIIASKRHVLRSNAVERRVDYGRRVASEIAAAKQTVVGIAVAA